MEWKVLDGFNSSVGAVPFNPEHMTRRIRQIVSGLEMDCTCRNALDQALDRFQALEHLRLTRHALVSARHQRDTILAILALLGEIDEIDLSEIDGSVFEEMAMLFDDVATAAHTGAAAMRELTDLPNSTLQD